ncbi:hypothetical protein [Agromyces aerolatus]|uniref:hypothetical protein n=1 Tax=Agromyces sp. LY-1074 TaxID=3074080 RepID=UPI00285AC6C2|nr:MULTISPECIES: hypothetical protein [unclassified Agromyces]MDR5701038.1 hypothetical protein [Agromyces sp. LY-1074]MDR5707678.1 hypothetical protein [Agromyces sp. LY-1358]
MKRQPSTHIGGTRSTRRVATAITALAALICSIGAAAPVQATTAAEIPGLVRHDALVDDAVKAGFVAYTATCPPDQPYLKRFHTGTYKNNSDGSRAIPGGVIVYEGNGPVWVTAGMTGRSEHWGSGPSGERNYEAYRGITGHYASLGGTSVRIVLWCVSDPFNGAVAEIRYP